MQVAFDLISDLHVETWPSFDWHWAATSAYCIVAGDIGRDRIQVLATLRHLSQCYQAVFYIDGNDEHRYHYTDIRGSYSDLAHNIKSIPNVVYLQENVVVVDGVAILGTNGWWTFDFDPGQDREQGTKWFENEYSLDSTVSANILAQAQNDAAYMIESVKRLQTHHDVKKIVCVTHTVPLANLIVHDPSISSSMMFNVMGNRHMSQVLTADTENKIHTWCFGHYHGSVDQIKHSVRFINNCRGRGNTQWKKHVFHPQRIVVDV